MCGVGVRACVRACVCAHALRFSSRDNDQPQRRRRWRASSSSQTVPRTAPRRKSSTPSRRGPRCVRLLLFPSFGTHCLTECKQTCFVRPRALHCACPQYHNLMCACLRVRVCACVCVCACACSRVRVRVRIFVGHRASTAPCSRRRSWLAGPGTGCRNLPRSQAVCSVRSTPRLANS